MSESDDGLLAIPTRPDGPRRFRLSSAGKVVAVVGLMIFGLGVLVNIAGSIRCAFGEIGTCGQGRGFLLFGAAAFVLAGSLCWAQGRPAMGALVALGGVVTAVLMWAVWEVSGQLLWLSAIPILLATWRIVTARPTIPRRPNEELAP